jgi:CRISPR-associated protein Csd2
VDATRGAEARYKIFVENRGYLADHKKRAYEAVGAKKGDSKLDEAQKWMCANYFDVRTFGAVLVGKKGEGYNCGQVRGPVQLTFARSVSPVAPLDLSITRVALENRGDKPDTGDDEEARTGTMGRKTLVPYRLYRAHGFFSPFFAKKTGLLSEDLSLFWEALQKMWDLDHSASRGLMACRGLYVFTHATDYGNAPAHLLFDRVKITAKPSGQAARAFSDYEVIIDDHVLHSALLILATRIKKARRRKQIVIGKQRFLAFRGRVHHLADAVSLEDGIEIGRRVLHSPGMRATKRYRRASTGIHPRR